MSEITLKDITLEYPIYDYGPRMFTSKVLSLASAGAIDANDKYNVVKGLDGINLTLKSGDRLGIIGGNGAGKTTMLKTMAGIYSPTSGELKTKGHITTLLSTGAGMDEEATGYQNIILCGLALGFRKKQVEARIKDIEEFCELGNFLSMPVKTYSAGMKLRLAFAVATSIEPEILLIDEGIGVGDAEFYDKAKKRVEYFVKKASILVIASHSDDLIKQFCNKAIYMAHGKIIYSGGVESAFEKRYEHTNQ